MRQHFEHNAMATQFALVIAKETEDYAQNAAKQVFSLIDALEHQLSRFIPDSDVSRINRMKAEDQLPIDFETWEVLKMALGTTALTSGAFDIGVAKHIDIFRATKTGILNEFEMNNALTKVQEEKVASRIYVDPEKPMVYCLTPGAQFDLGGIGKGYALDKANDLLEELGIQNFSISASDSTVLLKNNEEDIEHWSYTIANASEKMDLQLSNIAVSASGTSFQGNHIFDPRTGFNELASGHKRIWVASEKAAYSDAFATALFIVSTDEIHEIIKKSDNIIWVAYSEDGHLKLVTKNNLS
ncbi:FAD:protein FMN transferase [Roseivirga sp.]|uniref:FAD:protein FMN transferase n=1 Tax=Roseivirga sp. TaxID=1964215 RepID=UPI003B8D8C65